MTANVPAIILGIKKCAAGRVSRARSGAVPEVSDSERDTVNTNATSGIDLVRFAPLWF